LYWFFIDASCRPTVPFTTNRLSPYQATPFKTAANSLSQQLCVAAILNGMA